MTLNIPIHIDTLRIVLEPSPEALAELNAKLDKIMSTQAELATQLADLKTQNDKATAEQQAALAKLQAALDAAGQTSPEVDAALTALKTSIQRDDDLNPDAA